MTDNKIIEALECHAHNIHNTGRNFNCCDCDYIQFPNCSQRMSQDTLDLINRQQAEMKRLKKVNDSFTDIGKLYSEIKAEAIKYFAELLKEKHSQADILCPRRIISLTEKELDNLVNGVSNCQQNNLKECQYYKEHQEYECLPYDIGDTVYCVNGYGSQRYIEEFTVAEIRITEDGIWLTDTKGMEWLARVCHFNRESAEKELKSQKGLINIVNENFDKEDIIIHLTYEHDKTPQSEEVRKDIENYIRRLKEQRKNSEGNSFFYNRFMKTE